MVVNNSDFRIPNDIFLWHTFGDHGDEEEAVIISRKKVEINNSETGVTFWTIAMGSEGKMLDNWRDQLRNQTQGGFAYVVCGGDAKRGSRMKPEVATHFTQNLISVPSSVDYWNQVPEGIRATRKNLTSTISAAFVVADIEYVVESSGLLVNWWSQKNQKWTEECPPRHVRNGVKLLKKNSEGKPITTNADCRYILKLKYPYFVMVSKLPY